MGKNGAMIFDGDTFIDIEPFSVKGRYQRAKICLQEFFVWNNQWIWKR